jgi:predicted nucleic acid-binding protein
MGIVIDTCVFIHLEKQNHIIDFDKWKEEGDAFLSVISASELLIGVHRASSEARRLKRTAFVEAILAEISILDFTKEIARIHAEIYAYLAEKGQLIGAHDLIIAATALSYGYSLMTTNHDEFKRIPGLKVYNLNN